MEFRPEVILQNEINKLEWLKKAVLDYKCTNQKDIEIRVSYLTEISAEIGKSQMKIAEIIKKEKELYGKD